MKGRDKESRETNRNWKNPNLGYINKHAVCFVSLFCLHTELRKQRIKISS